jgi:hypothetical protein
MPIEQPRTDVQIKQVLWFHTSHLIKVVYDDAPDEVLLGTGTLLDATTLAEQAGLDVVPSKNPLRWVEDPDTWETVE